MPSKKKKYNARFPAGRIKKIMQSDEEVGKVAQAVPIIISKTLELFVESLLEKSLRITNSRNAKTLSPSHMKQCIMAESRFDFLRELVKNIPDISVAEEIAHDNSPGPPPNDVPYDLSMPSTSYGGYSSQSSTTTSATSSFSTSLPPPANGNNLRNGMQISNSIIRPPLQQQQITLVPTVSSRSDCKRSYDSAISANFYKGSSVIQHTSDLNISPPKIRRTDSEPMAASAFSLDLSATTTRLRRLQHQPKSVPCTSKESPQTPITPAPIINVDICNKPIVKIDYSNLALTDKDTMDDGGAGTTAASYLYHNRNNANFTPQISQSPVINIDLSNFQSVVKEQVTKPKTTLELDEDYDNI